MNEGRLTGLTGLASLVGFLVMALTLTSCQGNTYAKLLKKEKQQISDYINREGIRVWDEMPKEWGEKDYYAVPGYDNLYIHFIEQDTTQKEVVLGQTILVRYKKYGLGAYADTIRYWTTDDGPFPITFQLGNSADQYYCQGWTAAIVTMKHSGGHCRIICPSKLGFVDDNSSVTPYGYELKFNIKP